MDRRQLICTWKNIDAMHVLRGLERVILKIRTGGDSNDKIRKLHDLFGFKAWGNALQGGLCAGCIYRTEEFINIGMEARTGQRGARHLPESIHVEHTVPVAALANHLSMLACRGESDQSLQKFLISHSVATAVQRKQGHVVPTGIVAQGFARRAVDFETNRPFERYESNSILNILSDEKIDLASFSFSDHRAAMVELLDECGNLGLQQLLIPLLD